jgi:hypothetical protein
VNIEKARKQRKRKEKDCFDFVPTPLVLLCGSHAPSPRLSHRSVVPVRNALLDGLLNRPLDRNFALDVLDEVECEAVASVAGKAEEGEEGGGDVFALSQCKKDKKR